jgi:iron(III) transport system substrate-binding protein
MKWLTFVYLFVAVTPLFGAEKSVWQQQWDTVLAAAKREGKVNVTGPTGSEIRQALVEPFQKKYGITVEYLATEGRELAPKIMTEQAAGKYLWDVYVGGALTAFDSLIPKDALEPLEPALILPDIKDPKNWRGESPPFLGPARQLLVMALQHRGTVAVNTNLVKANELRSYKDLLDPKWRGKIIIDDPRRSGPGQATFFLFYMHPELGTDFIRALARHEVLLLRNFIQEVDFVAQGRYPILIGPEVPVEMRMKQGAPIALIDPRQLRESSDLNSKNGNVALYKNAPNANAAKIYLNWLLTQEGQTIFAQTMGYVSTRKDVPTDHVAPWRIPKLGSPRTDTPEAIEIRNRLRPILAEIFGR